jgi:FO synthase
VAAAIGRPARQRTTEYGTPSAERLATARSEEGRRALTLKLL